MIGAAVSLAVRYWRVIAVAVAMAALFGWHLNESRKAYQRGRAEVQQAWDTDKARRDRLAALEQQRQAQARLEAARENQRDLDRNAAAVRAADDAAARLRERIAALLRDRQAGPSQPGGAPADATAELLAHVQRRIDEAAGELAAVADARRAAGLQCEREYDTTQ